MDKKEKPIQFEDRGERLDYGERGDRKIAVVPLEEGVRGEQRGQNAAQSTSVRKPPQGGSGTAPPKNQRK